MYFLPQNGTIDITLVENINYSLRFMRSTLWDERLSCVSFDDRLVIVDFFDVLLTTRIAGNCSLVL
jgi:hypothetical protein